MKKYLETVKRQLYNWGLYILFVIGAIADLGFDQIQPLLEQIGLNDKCLGFIRLVIIIIASAKLKNQLPTQNIEKLQEVIDEKKDETIASIIDKKE